MGRRFQPRSRQDQRFLTELFGWTAFKVDDPRADGYIMFYLDDKAVAAAGPTFDEEVQPAWSTYVCSADAAATADAIKQAGGQVLMGPDDVMGQGRMVAATGPTGAYVAVWEPQLHRGAQVVNQAGALCWNELYTRDLPADHAGLHTR